MENRLLDFYSVSETDNILYKTNVIILHSKNIVEHFDIMNSIILTSTNGYQDNV